MSACFTCDNIHQCRLLTAADGAYEGRVRDECPDWAPCSRRQEAHRRTLRSLLDEYGVVRLAFYGQVQFQGEDVEHIDFKAMLRPGITFAEREHQLRYETDENGNVLPDDVCEKRPRSALQLRKYAQELGLTQGQSLGMTVEQIIKYLMSTEAEQGLVVKEKKSSAKKGPEMVQKENTMAEGKRILLPRRREEAPAQAQEAAEPAKGPEMAARPQISAKIGRPPARPKVEAPVEETETHGGAAAAQSGDLAAELAKFLLPEIQVRVAEVVEAKLAETVNRIVAAVTKEIQKSVTAVAETQAKETGRALNGITALHDLMAVNGLIQWIDPDSGDKSPLDPLLPENKDITIYIQD